VSGNSLRPALALAAASRWAGVAFLLVLVPGVAPSASEIVGEHFSRFYTPEDTDSGLPEKALNIAHQQGRFEAEGWRQRKDGSRFWASVVIDAIYDDGKLVGFAKIRAISPKGARPRFSWSNLVNSCFRRRKWKRWVSSPVAWPTISIIC
jgi:hypothetical protein